MMAGKVLNSDFTLLPLDNIAHHVASEDSVRKVMPKRSLVL